ncbi:hypothetical protein NQ318_013810, partial [Aromia moschata]
FGKLDYPFKIFLKEAVRAFVAKCDRRSIWFLAIAPEKSKRIPISSVNTKVKAHHLPGKGVL